MSIVKVKVSLLCLPGETLSPLDWLTVTDDGEAKKAGRGDFLVGRVPDAATLHSLPALPVDEVYMRPKTFVLLPKLAP